MKKNTKVRKMSLKKYKSQENDPKKNTYPFFCFKKAKPSLQKAKPSLQSQEK
jgi:hypothetical protein